MSYSLLRERPTGKMMSYIRQVQANTQIQGGIHIDERKHNAESALLAYSVQPALVRVEQKYQWTNLFTWKAL